MHIGIDASRALRAEKTGTEWYSRHLIDAMTSIDHTNIYTLYTDRAATLHECRELPGNFFYKHLLWPPRYGWTQVRLSWEMAIKKPDILFVPSHAIPVIHPKKTITTIHDVGFLLWKENYTRKEYDYLVWSTAFAVKECLKIITISEFTKQDLIANFNARPEQVAVIHHGYDSQRYQPKERGGWIETSILEKNTIKSPYLLYVGRLEQRKNLSLLLKAFESLKKEFPDLSLVIAGSKGCGGDSIIKEMKSHLYSSSIHYLGWCNEDDKLTLLHNAHALVLPSYYEGFGLPIIEAQACGVPVVCSDTSALPEVAGKGALYFDPHSSERCVEALRMSFAAHTREMLILAGLENAQRFSWEQCAQETIEVLTA